MTLCLSDMSSFNDDSIRESPAYRRLVEKLTKENLWLFIINLLIDRPMYAYEVKVKLRECYGLRAATVTVYTVLYRMTREGLLTTYEESGTKYYQVTEKGLEVYRNAISFIEKILKVLKEGKVNEKGYSEDCA